MRPNPPTRGFTLIEISAVIVILGIILVMGMVRVDSLTPQRSLISGSRVLQAALQEMHASVLLRGEPATLVYDLTGGGYRLEYPPPAPLPDALPLPPGSPPPSPEVSLEGRLPEGVCFRRVLRRGVPDQAEGELRLRITSGGACPPHAVVLGLDAGEGPVEILRVDPLSGDVTAFGEEKPFEQLFTYVSDDRETLP